MENEDMDSKIDHNNSLRKVFGDKFMVMNCDKVRTKKTDNDEGKLLFCEMIIKTDENPDFSLLPDGFSIVMEVEA